MSALSICKTTPSDTATWQAAMDIYRQAFPEWEREPEDILLERIHNGRYVMYCGLENNTVIGFYLLDINPSHHYALFCFLAVSEHCRGRGFGSDLCRDAVARFQQNENLDWLLIEAEDRQAIFYGRLGFKKIAMTYNVPKFDAADSVPMHLMTIATEPNQHAIDKNTLTQLIEHIFVTGYHLPKDDVRIQQQVAAIPNSAALVNWPQ